MIVNHQRRLNSLSDGCSGVFLSDDSSPFPQGLLERYGDLYGALEGPRRRLFYLTLRASARLPVG
jgi:hypothetical protein